MPNFERLIQNKCLYLRCQEKRKPLVQFFGLVGRFLVIPNIDLIIMKLFRTLFFILPLLLMSCSLFTKTDKISSSNDFPFDLFYGMSYNEEKDQFIENVLDTIPDLKHYEFNKKWYHSYSDTYHASFRAQLGLYIDRNIPEPIWTNLQPILNENFAENISFDAPFDSIYSKEIAEPVATPHDYANKWGKLMEKFSEHMQPTLPDSAYQDIAHLRVCGVVHKIFEDDDWATYLVEFSFSYHGGLGCPSYADYISFNKHDGHRLTEEEILSMYDKEELEELLDEGLYKAKIENGEDPIGGPHGYTGKLFGASGIAFLKNSVLIYFQPYIAGSASEGQYNIIINNNDLK